MQPVLRHHESLDAVLYSMLVFCANYSLACLLMAVVFGIVAWMRAGVKWRISLVVVLLLATAARIYIRSWLFQVEG
jgi:hypothetical protein